MPQLSVHVLSGGERVPTLHDEHELPLFYPTFFVTSQLRNAGAAVNTIRNKVADITVLLRWQENQARDVVEEFRNGRFPIVADIVSLRDFAQRDMHDLIEGGAARVWLTSRRDYGRALHVRVWLHAEAPRYFKHIHKTIV